MSIVAEVSFYESAIVIELVHHVPCQGFLVNERGTGGVYTSVVIGAPVSETSQSRFPLRIGPSVFQVGIRYPLLPLRGCLFLDWGRVREGVYKKGRNRIDTRHKSMSNTLRGLKIPFPNL